MNNFFSYIAFSLIIIFSISFVSSNFACGVVNSSESLSSSWADVIVYFEENKSDFTNCQVNPEGKFCCDLENISSVEFKVGKKIFAEVDDIKRGLVGGPVNTYVTDKGYDIFPDIQLKKIINFNLEEQGLYINKSSVSSNISLGKIYRELKYSINSSEGYIENKLCSNCNYSEFLINLSKGKNELIIFNPDNKIIIKNITLYNLDYLNLNLTIDCNKCKYKKNFIYVPSNEEMVIHSSFNSSHNISGNFLLYLPNEWSLMGSTNKVDFSKTHTGFVEEVLDKRDFSVNYKIKTKKSLIKQNYLIYQQINEYSKLTKVRTFNLRFIPINRNNLFEKNYPNYILEQYSSPKNPAILVTDKEYIQSAAIFTNKEVDGSYSYLDFNLIKKGKEIKYTFKIFTTIPKQEIENIFIVFKVEKNKILEATFNGSNLPLQFYKEDIDYNYYSIFTQEKGPFEVIIS